MFIVSLHYIKPLGDVDKYVDAHVAYLKENYASGHFIASGRKIPRTGGIIFCTAASRAEVEDVLAQDPFNRAGVAEYDIVEFVPSMTAKGFENLKTV